MTIYPTQPIEGETPEERYYNWTIYINQQNYKK
jgi:hypothetical protein